MSIRFIWKQVPTRWLFFSFSFFFLNKICCLLKFFNSSHTYLCFCTKRKTTFHWLPFECLSPDSRWSNTIQPVDSFHAYDFEILTFLTVHNHNDDYEYRCALYLRKVWFFNNLSLLFVNCCSRLNSVFT